MVDELVGRLIELSSSSCCWIVLMVEELANLFSLLRWNLFGVDVAVAMLALRMLPDGVRALELVIPKCFDNAWRAPAGERATLVFPGRPR